MIEADVRRPGTAQRWELHRRRARASSTPTGAARCRGSPDGFALPETLDDFRVVSVEAEEFSYRMLRDQIASLQAKGVDASESWVDLHLKVALPVASLVLMLVAVPLAARGTRVSSLPAAVGLGFVDRLLLLHRAGLHARARPDRRPAAAARRVDVEPALRPDRRLLPARQRLSRPRRSGDQRGRLERRSSRAARAARSCTAPPARRRPCPRLSIAVTTTARPRRLVPVPADGAAVGAAHLAQLRRLPSPRSTTNGSLA